MKFTTVVVARDGEVYDLGNVKINDKGIFPVKYPRSEIKDGNKIKTVLNIPAFSMVCSEQKSNELMAMSKEEVKAYYSLK